MRIKKKWCGCELHEVWQGEVKIDAFILPCCKHAKHGCNKLNCRFCMEKRRIEDEAV